MIYTIKPLEWNEEPGLAEDAKYLVAWTPFGYYEITDKVSRVFLETPNGLEFTSNSVEHAKELAWKDWTKRLEGALALFNSVKDIETLAQLEMAFYGSAINFFNP